MGNVAEQSHPWMGKEAVYLEKNVTPELLKEPRDGKLVMRPGDKVVVEKVFYNWNNVKGLTILWVRNLSSTNSISHTHVSPEDLGFKE